MGTVPNSLSASGGRKVRSPSGTTAAQSIWRLATRARSAARCGASRSAVTDRCELPPSWRLRDGAPVTRGWTDLGLEHARDRRDAAQRHHDRPAEGDGAGKDDGELGHRIERDREQSELEPDDDGVVNKIH